MNKDGSFAVPETLNSFKRARYSNHRFSSGTPPACAETRLTKGYDVGRRLGAYCLEKAVGCGGMGEVYQAFRHDLGIKVALKVWNPQLGQTREEFLLERHWLSKLNHPHITRMYDGGTTEEGWPWFAMEWVPGLTLNSWQRIYQPSVWECLELMVKVVDALAYVHRMGIVHLDLKPANILVDPCSETVKVLDFGLASFFDSKGLSPDQISSGLTPKYASPEQLAAKPINHQSDIYSLAMVFKELLAHTAKGKSVAETNPRTDLASRLRQSAPMSPQPAPKSSPIRFPGFSEVLNRRLRKRLLDDLGPCLEKQRHRRASSLDQLLIELRQIQWHYREKVFRQQKRRAIFRRYKKAFHLGVAILAMLVMSPARETIPQKAILEQSGATTDNSIGFGSRVDKDHEQARGKRLPGYCLLAY